MIIEHTCVAFLWQMNNMINTVRIWLFEKHPIYVETCKCLITILNIYIGFNKGSNDSDSEYGMY